MSRETTDRARLAAPAFAATLLALALTCCTQQSAPDKVDDDTPREFTPVFEQESADEWYAQQQESAANAALV